MQGSSARAINSSLADAPTESIDTRLHATHATAADAELFAPPISLADCLPASASQAANDGDLEGAAAFVERLQLRLKRSPSPTPFLELPDVERSLILRMQSLNVRIGQVTAEYDALRLQRISQEWHEAREDGQLTE